jgi:hypothetical protein
MESTMTTRKSYRTLVLDAWLRHVCRDALGHLHAEFSTNRPGARVTYALDVLTDEPQRLLALFSCLRLRNAVDWVESGVEEISIDVAEVLEGVSEDDVIFSAFAPLSMLSGEWPQDEAEDFAEDMSTGAAA